MRIFLFTIISILSFGSANSQFNSAKIQASGLTCAMCTKAINNALEQVSFIQSVDPDISSSTFNIVFKKNSSVDIDELRKAVEDAGFSVSRMKIKGDFQDLAVKNDEHVTYNGATFHFLKINDQVLKGEKEITLVDKNFVGAKEFKKYSAATRMACVHTGKAETCCTKSSTKAERIYHVTI